MAPKAGKPKAKAWSEQVDAKERKADRKLKKERKREFLKRQREQEKQPKQPQEDDDDDEDDWDELAQEERMAKKLKRGKINQMEFDETVFGASDDDE